jgi:beta-alanine degradation protein BauB
MKSRSLWLFAGLVIGCLASSTPAQTPTTTYRVPQFENDDVKVWKTVILPNSPLSMHRHEHGRALVVLRGGPVTIVSDTGAKASHTWETGRAYWLDADPPGTAMHADVNESAVPIEVVVVELKNDTRRQGHPPGAP